MPQDRYDVVVIGSGPGGYVAAARAAQLGLAVAVVEKDPFYGGTCLWRGCIPTKALLENAAVYEQARHAREFGIRTGEISLDFPAVMQRKTKVVRKLGKGVESLLTRSKVALHTGHGRMSGPGKVAVTRPDGSVLTLQARHVLLATGSAPRLLPGLAEDGRRVVTSDGILEIKEIPRRMVVLGAGAVGVEFASIFHRFGSEVAILEMLPRAVPLEDEEVSRELEKVFRKQGIALHTGVKAGGIKASGETVKVEYAPAEGAAAVAHNPGRGAAGGTLEADLLLVAVGRRPLTDDLGLDTVPRVQLDRGFVKVDGMMRTGEPGVYAIGDIVATPLLAHVASAEGILAVEHMAGREVRPINYDHVPNATYCEPEIASVGLTEAKAREKGYEVKVGRFPFTHSSKAPILGATDGFVKIVSEARHGELLGMHVIGPRATEMIAEAGIALRTEATVEELHRTIHAHPTLSEAVPEAARAVFEHAIHH
ncbi:MAG TPA: dihydrolipoyl dehydrogenase [Candidatus Polarisedimenticolia bacterium]|nr:dihydrolipoyl dehydrogenase [Candidatus Polarisedimenticolia bacterium]